MSRSNLQSSSLPLQCIDQEHAVDHGVQRRHLDYKRRAIQIIVARVDARPLLDLSARADSR